MMQFLAEAAILTVIGGVIGIILGIIGAYGICSVISASMQMVISPGISVQLCLQLCFPVQLVYSLEFTLRERQRSSVLLKR